MTAVMVKFTRAQAAVALEALRQQRAAFGATGRTRDSGVAAAALNAVDKGMKQAGVGTVFELVDE